MRWDCESVAKRGSRLVGLDSMRKVREEGSDGLRLEQPERETVASARKRKNTEKELTQRSQRRRDREEKKKEILEESKVRRGWMERLAGRGIGYFTEDRWAAGAGCGGQVRGALVKCFVGEKGEGEGFLGAFGNTETYRGQDFDAGESGGKLADDQRIVRATTGNDELVDLRFGRDEAIQGIDDRECGEDCGCADEIVRLGAIASAEGQEFFYVGVAIVFAAGGFW